MARSDNSRARNILLNHISHKYKRKNSTRRRLAAFGGAIASAVVVTNATATPAPVRTSILTGQKWLEELISSPVRIREQLGVSRYIFHSLVKELRKHGLKNSKFISADEQLAIFLHFARTGASSRMLQERFQRSGDTISK